MSQTQYTPTPEENKLGLTDPQAINEREAAGIIRAEIYLLTLDVDTEPSVSVLLELHRRAFSELYDWAGQWRRNETVVGHYVPPAPALVPSLMYQFMDQVVFLFRHQQNREELVELLSYAHHRLVQIHPFVNGNGRTARLFMNALALLKSGQTLQLYHREGEDRAIYVGAIRQADVGEYGPLRRLIERELSL
jgi:cell filamentation protein